tara:strand:- start:8177 stop:8620 length:444 start_codon:yes stop_codon:yes gene_type:complete
MQIQEIKNTAYALGIVSFLGIVDAAYLTYSHFRHTVVPCSIGGCETVLTSEYATIGPVPVAAIGAIYYAIILILTVFLFKNQNKKILGIILVITGAGFLATLYFIYLQLFVIESICLYCMGSAVATTMLFVISLTTLSQLRKKTERV